MELIFLIVVFIIIAKTAPKHPKKHKRQGSEVGCIDYLLGNWDADVEDPDWYEGKVYDEDGNDAKITGKPPFKS